MSLHCTTAGDCKDIIIFFYICMNSHVLTLVLLESGVAVMPQQSLVGRQLILNKTDCVGHSLFIIVFFLSCTVLQLFFLTVSFNLGSWRCTIHPSKVLLQEIFCTLMTIIIIVNYHILIIYRRPGIVLRTWVDLSPKSSQCLAYGK